MAARAKHLRPVTEPEEATPVVSSRSGRAALPPATPFAGERLDSYKLVSPLAQGGMAEVFLAAQEVEPLTYRPAVIKRLYAHLASDSNLVQMFLDEAKLLCQLEHPHVVRTYEAGMIDGHCCIAMEYLEGQTLAALLRHAHEQSLMSPALAIEIVDSILSGLHYAHEARDEDGRSLQIVHRDVSPHNVFITNDGQVKLIDFGVAKARTHEFRTRAGIVKGKPGYIAPEQAKAESVDRRADVWSVGVLLWEALTGVRLFKADTEAAAAMLTLSAKLEPPSAFRADVPTVLDAIVLRALARDVEKRYQTAFDMRMELQEASPWSSRDTNGLANLMQTTFAEAIVEQKRLVSVLMTLSDSTPPSGRPSARSMAESGARPRSGSPPSVPPPLPPPPPPPPQSPKRDGKIAVRAPEASNWRKRTGAVFAAAFALSFALVLGVSSLLSVSSDEVTSPPATGVAAKSIAPPAQNREPPAPAAPPAVVAPAPPPKAVAPATPASTVITPEPVRPVQPRAVVAPAAPREQAPSAEAVKPAPLLRAVAPAAPKADAPPPAPEPASEPVSPETTGLLTFDTTPWSIVSVGGRSLGQTPLIKVKLPAGVHTLVLKNPELGLETTYVVKIEAGKAQSRRIGLE